MQYTCYTWGSLTNGSGLCVEPYVVEAKSQKQAASIAYQDVSKWIAHLEEVLVLVYGKRGYPYYSRRKVRT